MSCALEWANHHPGCWHCAFWNVLQDGRLIIIRIVSSFIFNVAEARSRGLAGATAWRGFLAFGPTSRIRTSKVLDLSTDLPIIIEISDEASKIEQFLPVLHDLFETANCGGLVTVEQVEVIHYLHAASGKKSSTLP